MKLRKTSITFTGLALALGSSAFAATTFVPNPGNNINDAANWSNGLPTSAGNVGTVNVDSNFPTFDGSVTDYHLNFTGGRMNTDTTGTKTFIGGVQTLSGGDVDLSNRSIATSNGAVTTVNTGSIFRGGSVSISNSNFTVSGGQLFGRNQFGGVGDINLNGTTVFTLNSGTVIAGESSNNSATTGSFGNNATTAGGVWNLNGGTLTAFTLRYRSVSTMVMGGSTVGSATFTNGFATSNHSDANIRIDWLPGSLMTLTIGLDDWAKTNWDAGRMFFDGDSQSDLDNLSWADATNSSIGLGGGYYFDWNGTTNTLALAIPEPSAALLGGIGMFFLLRRGQR